MTHPTLPRQLHSLAVLLVITAVPCEVAGDTLFGATTFSGNINTINTVSGVGTQVGAAGSLGFFGVTGLAYSSSSGTLYGIDGFGTQALFAINPVTGVGSSVGPIGFFSQGLAYDPASGKLFTVQLNNDLLVSIDPVTGVGTSIGPVGAANVTGLAFEPSSGVLYAVDSFSDQLLTIDPTSGATTAVGPLGFGSVAGLAFDSAGALYSAEVANTSVQQLITIDVTNGAGAAVGPPGSLSSRAMSGLAFAPVPEPHSLLLGALANVCVLLLRRRAI